MRTLVRIVQIFVGVLFIVSGLVKANDPLGLSYKMQEFFELWNGELANSGFFLKNGLISLFNFLHEQSLALSIFMITLEIMAGLALLLGWMKNFILWLLLVLIVFFTFLTGYAYLSGKFTNCGCFGDCLPITPLTSFIKDLVLLGMVLILLFGKRHITPVFSARARMAILVSSLLATLLLQWYVLNYLPIADCLPFKKGNNITQQMQPPPGAITDSFAIRYIYEKEGRQYEFAPENLPADYNTYKFIDRKDKLVRKGNAEPAIKGFSLNGTTGEDSTQVVLSQSKAILVFAQHLQAAEWIDEFKKPADVAKSKNIPVYLASQALEDAANSFQKYNVTGIQFFNCDFTVVRTAARTEPTIYILKNGTIVNKFSRHQLDEATAALQKL
ncbi:MAG TPA: BT_3928 family protein [Flavisolibacter sp.]|nr:BT_3928 family protein [Flavisolibacter sp.]